MRSSQTTVHAVGRAPESAPAPFSAEQIREQLERLLASPRFASSPRCQMLLRHVVGAAVDGNVESLKERNLGIEVFRRDAAYDTNADPVVRIAASEVRKKLAQYYFEPDHHQQIRIEIPIGSYLPVFSPPEQAPEAAAHPVAVLPLSEPPPAAALRRLLLRPWPLAAALAALLALAAGVWLLLAVPSPLDAFWAPLTGSSHQVLLCIGHLRATQVQLDSNTQRNPDGSPIVLARGTQETASLPILALNDSITMANIAGYLRSRHKPFFARSEAMTNYEDLQRVPVVLIGALDNDWTMRLMRTMRYQFAQDLAQPAWWITDQKRPGARLGEKIVDPRTPITQDMAIVARVLDGETRQPVVVAAGITSEGTLAAGNFVTDPEAWAEFSRTAPADWRNRNLELLLTVNVVDNHPGPARVVDAVIW